MSAGRWSLAAAASVAAHGALLALGLWAVAPRNAPEQQTAESRLRIETLAVAQTEAEAEEPPSEAAAEAAGQGDSVVQGAIPVGRAAPAPLPQAVAQAQAAPAETMAPRPVDQAAAVAADPAGEAAAAAEAAVAVAEAVAPAASRAEARPVDSAAAIGAEPGSEALAAADGEAVVATPVAPAASRAEARPVESGAAVGAAPRGEALAAAHGGAARVAAVAALGSRAEAARPPAPTLGSVESVAPMLVAETAAAESAAPVAPAAARAAAARPAAQRIGGVEVPVPALPAAMADGVVVAAVAAGGEAAGAVVPAEVRLGAGEAAAADLTAAPAAGQPVAVAALPAGAVADVAPPADAALPARAGAEAAAPLAAPGVAAAVVVAQAALTAPARPRRDPAPSVTARRAPAAEAPRPALAAPRVEPAQERVAGTLAWTGGAQAEMGALSLAAIQSFVPQGELGAGDAVRDGLERLLSSVPCARLQTVFLPETGALELRGHVPEAGLDAPLLAALRRQVGDAIPVEGNVLVLPAPQCSMLAGLDATGLPQSTDQLTNPRIVGSDAHARVYDFAGGERMQFELTGPDYDALVYADYYDAEGMVIHLQPNELVGLPHVAPAGRLEIGRDGLEMTVAPPYGQEIVVALATSAPLYDGLRPLREPAGPYLDFLRERVAAARAADPGFRGEWVYFFVRTRA